MAKINTDWYDDLLMLYQKVKGLGLESPSKALRDIAWNCVKDLMYGRLKEYIRSRKLYKDVDLSQRLYQEVFFIFCKACDVWDKSKGAKFLTFLGDILTQEFMNITSMEFYNRKKEKRISRELKIIASREETEEDIFRRKLKDEIHEILDRMVFETVLERDVVYAMLYGDSKELSSIRKRSGMNERRFGLFRKELEEKVRRELLEKSSREVKEFLEELLGKKSRQESPLL